ncbi:MAG: ATP-binding cassette domain-containing protein, partial [Nitrososphaerota archaeon]|nr:ATP-binding cassette domain-containing protein [Nitrososphaerota archaeon]
MTASGEAIRVDDLVVRYGQKTAVNHLSFSVKKGEIYGLLGPNGAGKTSTIKALIGLTERDSGTVEVLGRDIDS